MKNSVLAAGHTYRLSTDKLVCDEQLGLIKYSVYISTPNKLLITNQHLIWEWCDYRELYILCGFHLVQ